MLKRRIKRAAITIRKKGVINTVKRALYVIAKRLYRHIKKLAKITAGRVDPTMILFDSPFYGDNAKVLADYILKHKPSYKIVYFVEKDQKVTPHKRIKYIKRSYKVSTKSENAYSLNAYYYAAKAKYIFYTHSFSWAGERNKGQLIVNLWHGTGYKAARTIGAEDIFDFMIVPGDIFVKSKARFYSCKEEKILPLGYPRYDLYQSSNFKKIKQFYEDLDINTNDNKVIFWLPTFAADGDLLAYENPLPYIYSGIPLIENLKQALHLDNFCKENSIIIVVKKHNYRHLKTPLDNHLEKFTNIIFLSDESFKTYQVELYELLPFTDGLISDFSSATVDYLLLDKPIGYIVKDINDYAKTRGFVFENPLKYMPGEHIYHTDELKSFILDVSEGIDKYRKLREIKVPIMHHKTDNYSQRILDYFSL